MDALTDAVKSALATITARPVGDHDAPPIDSGANPTSNMPYTVLFNVSGGTVEGPPLGDLHSMRRIVFQTIVVGVGRDQVDLLAQRVRNTFLARNSGGYVTAMSPTGFAVVDREHVLQGGITREGQIFNRVDQFSLFVVPSQ